MWLNDLLPPKTKTRPTRPTSKNTVGRPQSLMAVAPYDTSDTSDTKKAKNISSGEIHQKEEGITQNSSDDPRSVRLLPERVAPEQQLSNQERSVVRQSYTRKGFIEDAPTTAQLIHARRMLVDCPSTGGKRHCWHCSRCDDTRTCSAWRTSRNDVERFRQSEKPYSLYLVEGGEEETPGLSDWLERVAPAPTPDNAAFCSSYWKGCFECSDYLAGKLRFCARYNRLYDNAAEVTP